jgi:hypothetical protein
MLEKPLADATVMAIAEINAAGGLFVGAGAYMIAMSLKLASPTSMQQGSDTPVPDFMLWNAEPGARTSLCCINHLSFLWIPFQSLWFGIASAGPRADRAGARVRRIPQARHRRVPIDHHSRARAAGSPAGDRRAAAYQWVQRADRSWRSDHPRLVDPTARIRRQELVRAPVGVERAEQAMVADRLRQALEARYRALPR